MVKESGYPKGARGGEDGFTHTRGDEDEMPRCTPVPRGARTARTKPMDGPDRLPQAHGYGHKGGQIDGVHRLSGDKRAHRIGAKRGK